MKKEVTQGRAKILEFESRLRDHPEITVPLLQYFVSGVYARQMKVAGGTLLTGRIHKRPCINVVLEGELEVMTDEGYQHIIGPAIFTSPAGTKRAMNIISDSIWITFHAYDGPEQDPDAMAEHFTVENFDQLQLEDQSA
jgi:hypothetical protein